jgi:DNA-binding phage protein
MRVLEPKDVVRLLHEEIERAGSQTAWAKKARVNRTEVNKILQGRKPPTETILKALKLRTVIVSD